MFAFNEITCILSAETIYDFNPQWTQMRQLRASIQPNTEVIIQMDFSENYSCMYQDEISAVHYDKHHTTIHPMVVH